VTRLLHHLAGCCSERPGDGQELGFRCTVVVASCAAAAAAAAAAERDNNS